MKNTLQPNRQGIPLPWQMNDAQGTQYPIQNVQNIDKDIPLNEMQMLALKAYIEMMRLKNYSHNSIQTYRNLFTQFLIY